MSGDAQAPDACTQGVRNNLIPFILLEAIAPEDRPDFEAIYLRHRSMLLCVARRALGASPLAEDAVEESFIALARSFEKWREKPDEEIRRWLITVTRYRALAILNEQNALGDAPDARLPAPPEDDRTELERIVDALPPRYAQVIRLRYLEGFSAREIGRMLDMSPGAVRQRIARAKEKLRALLIENGYEEYFT